MGEGAALSGRRVCERVSMCVWWRKERQGDGMEWRGERGKVLDESERSRAVWGRGGVGGEEGEEGEGPGASWESPHVPLEISPRNLTARVQ